MNPKPLKRFGQNYLVDKNIIRKIVDKFNPQPNEKIIEIGPGRGSLTEALLEKNREVTAIEIDTRVIEDLKERMPELKLLNKDFLKCDLRETFPGVQSYRVIGNIPYNITSPILFKLLENRDLFSDAMLMVQYEVAKRITAKVGIKDYGILSVILGAFSEVEFCFKISPNVFYPKPKVDSAIIHLKFHKNFPEDIDPASFIKIVKSAFGNRRKTLKNSFKNSILASRDFTVIEPYLSKRAEQLNIDDYFFITRLLS